MSFEKQPGNERKKLLLQIAAPVLAFFAGQQTEKEWGGPNYETEEVSPNTETRSDIIVHDLSQKIREFTASGYANRAFNTPTGRVNIRSSGPDNATFVIETIRDKTIEDPIVYRGDYNVVHFSKNVETSVYRITDDSLYFARGQNLHLNDGEPSMEYAVHYQFNEDARTFRIVETQTAGAEGELANVAEAEMSEDLLLLDWIIQNERENIN